jgi:predicted glycogen debranching enzyme
MPTHIDDVTTLVRRLPFDPRSLADDERQRAREWLVTNGLGGYATGTLAGLTTRRYHGLLVAALPAPVGRVVMVSRLLERLRAPDGTVTWLGGDGPLDVPEPGLRPSPLQAFRLEAGLPVWTWDADGVVIERRLWMARFQNTVYVQYRLLDAPGPVRLAVRPALAGRPHEAPVDAATAMRPSLTATPDGLEVHLGADLPPVRMTVEGASATAFTLDAVTGRGLPFSVEASRGYTARGDAWSPGYFRITLVPGVAATIALSTESWDAVRAHAAEDAHQAELERRRRLLALGGPGPADEVTASLMLAADQFVIAPATRTGDMARARAAGDEPRSVIAGYHWFTDWGRDTMIALEGLTLCTGRATEARDILLTFARYFRDGLIPNLFPEGTHEGLYHTADATLWFFHALDRYATATGDLDTVRAILPALDESIAAHRRGTRFGIGVDPGDGLLRQGAEGYQLTWMDAKVDGWVVTPRRGKAVEINALWFNALRLLDAWHSTLSVPDAAGLRALADQAKASFNARFWDGERGHLRDVVDGPEGDDPACRPNQLFAMTLRHPVLAPERWAPVLAVVEQRLLTPVGLRSLDPGHPDYKPRYDGDLRSRDAAYHQGTVWGWLIGPFVDAWLRVHPERPAEARRFLMGLAAHLDDGCVGSVSEIFDAEPPYTPRGCIAQAWSVAELLRTWIATRA